MFFLAGDGIFAGDSFLVERVRIIENVVRANASFLQVRRQFVIFRPVVFAFPAFGCRPGEVHADELESRRRDHREVFFMAVRKVDIDADAGRKDRFGQVGGAGAAGNQKDEAERFQVH